MPLIEQNRTIFTFTSKNRGYKKSNQTMLACEVADDAVRVSRAILAKIEDPTTDSDVFDSLCISYCDLQKILMDVLKTNFWRWNKKPVRKRKKAKPMAELLR